MSNVVKTFHSIMLATVEQEGEDMTNCGIVTTSSQLEYHNITGHPELHANCAHLVHHPRYKQTEPGAHPNSPEHKLTPNAAHTS